MERTIRVGDGKPAKLSVLALAAAMAVSQLTAVCHGADAPKAEAAKPAAPVSKEEQAKQLTEAAKQKEAEAKRALEEAKRLTEQAKQLEAEAKREKEAEAKRVAEENARKAEMAKAEAAKKAAEEKRIQEEARKKAEDERRAVAMLAEAKQAYDAKNYPAAINKYREFVTQFPKRAEVGTARWGIALAMIDSPDKDWNGLAGELQQVVDLAEIPDRGRAHYWLATSLRISGEQMLSAAGSAKPEVQKDQTAKAIERLGQAAQQYTIAEAALIATVNPKPAADVKELPAALDLAARARAEGADALAKSGKSAEAVERVKGMLADPLLARSSHKAMGLVVLGRALVEQKDYAGAFMALSQVAPFDQSLVGLAARCELARIKSLTGEKPEAAAEYAAILTEYGKVRKAADESLRNRPAWRGRPLELRQAEELGQLMPAFVLQAAYDGGQIHFEYGQFTEAQSRFTIAAQLAPEGEMKQRAQLLLGASMAQSKLPEAEKALRLVEASPLFGDQATWWIGRLQRSLADPNNAGQAQNQYRAAIASFVKAAEKAQALEATDPAAKARRAEMLLDRADTLVLLKQFKEAAPIYETAAINAADLDLAQAAHEKWAMSLCKAGEYAASEAACGKFLEKYSRSTLKPNVLFWQAENSYRTGIELAMKRDPAEQAKAKAMQETAATRYQAVADKYPESAQAGAARFGLGMSYYRRGDWENAAKYLSAIPDSERTGEIGIASYYQAECLFKTLPEGSDDALSAARLSGGLEEIAKLLSGFVASNENLPESPDAMLKLADVYQRNAALLADQQEKQKAFQSARETYEKLLTKFPKHPAYAQAVLDRARLIAAVGDAGGAINELNRFRNDATLSKSDVAPAALIRLSSIMVANGRAVDAAAMLEKTRQQFEPALKADANRANLVPGLMLAHGLALKESGKPKEALGLMDAIIKDYATSPEAAEASLASIQVRKDEAIAKLRTAMNAVAAVPMEKPVDPKLLAEQAAAVKAVAEIAGAFAQHAERIAEKSAGSDLHVRTLRDAAATWRVIGDVEVFTIRREKAAESLKTLADRLAKAPAIGKSNSAPRAAEIKLSTLPITPAEAKAREYYGKALEANADSPVCNELRFDLAEMHYKRGEAEPAIQLLTAAIDKNPPQPQLEFIRVKLGMCQLLKGDVNGAAQQAQTALLDGAHPVRPAAYLLKGMALLQAKNPGEAATVLVRFFSGAEKYANSGAVAEEGLFRLGQAYAASNNWAESRAAYEKLLARFGASKFAAEARYGIGVTFQQEKQFDRAIEAFADVTRRTSGELAANAQLQIGLCRAEQKRWKDAVTELLIVPVSYDYAEIAVKSSMEAAKALQQLKQPTEAKEVLQRIVHDHPATAWAAEAAKRIKEIQ